MLRMGRGVGRLNKPISIKHSADVVLAGAPVLAGSTSSGIEGWRWPTMIDLSEHNFVVSGGVQLCVQDLKLMNGRSRGAILGGGALQVEGGGLLQMKRTHIDRCVTERDGRALCVVRSTLELSWCLLTRNRAPGAQHSTYGSGGAIQLFGSIARLQRCVLNQNQAYQFGGAIQLWGPASSSSRIDIDHCTMNGNSAGGEGGAMLSGGVPGSDVRVANSVFTDNEGGKRGGAVCVRGIGYRGYTPYPMRTAPSSMGYRA